MRTPVERGAHAIALEFEGADRCPFGVNTIDGGRKIRMREIEEWDALTKAAARRALKALLDE